MRLVFVLCLALSASFAGPARAAGVDALFAASLVDTDGRPFPLAAYRGKPLIVNFWARWCGPCRTEIPELVALQAAHADRELTVLGVALEEDGPAVRDFLAAYGVGYPVVLGRNKGIWLMQSLGNGSAGLPFTLVIDRKGEIILRKLGPFGKDDFHPVADRLLN